MLQDKTKWLVRSCCRWRSIIEFLFIFLPVRRALPEVVTWINERSIVKTPNAFLLGPISSIILVPLPLLLVLLLQITREKIIRANVSWEIKSWLINEWQKEGERLYLSIIALFSMYLRQTHMTSNQNYKKKFQRSKDKKPSSAEQLKRILNWLKAYCVK